MSCLRRGLLGSRRLTVLLRAEGYSINRKRVQRLVEPSQKTQFPIGTVSE
jgi:hypothetical protein